MGRRILILVVAAVVWSIAPVRAETPNFEPMLAAVQDAGLRTTLRNSIAIGLISNRAEFDAAVSRRHGNNNHGNNNHGGNNGNSNNSGNPGGNQGDIGRQISQRCAGLAAKDVDAIRNVPMNRGNKLFNPLSARIPPSYEAVIKLAAKFNPSVGTPELPRCDKDIDAYLATIANDPVIKHALETTKTRLEDLKNNWFGPGAGFEHVICGETKSSSVSGYHWWYKFYTDEMAGRTIYQKSVDHAGDANIFTGSFSWDPDGNGPLPTCRKKKGGFSIGNSAQVLLALGHIAIETARQGNRVPSAIQFNADVNGQTYSWQLYTFGGTIRSLYPICGSGDTAGGPDRMMEYYDLEEDAIRGLYGPGSLQIH